MTARTVRDQDMQTIHLMIPRSIFHRIKRISEVSGVPVSELVASGMAAVILGYEEDMKKDRGSKPPPGG